MKRWMSLLAALALPAWSAEPGATPAAAAAAATDLQPAVNTSPVATSTAATPAPPSAPAQGVPPRAPGAQTAAGSRPARAARDRLELDTTQITGNRELPRVLYVVPWKRSDLGDLTGRPANSLLDEVLAPIDRDVFRRQNRYFDALKPDTAGGSVGAGAEGEK
jgi:hypothetical protein